MEPLNSGVNLTVWDFYQQSWVRLEEAFFEEGKTYRWRCLSEEPIRVAMQGIPLPMTKCSDGWEGIFETPFQSGIAHFEIWSGEQAVKIETFIYPDGRKLTQQQYEQLLTEILEEALFVSGGMGWS